MVLQQRNDNDNNNGSTFFKLVSFVAKFHSFNLLIMLPHKEGDEPFQISEEKFACPVEVFFFLVSFHYPRYPSDSDLTVA